jgi:multidrug efflux pump subunit AcrA (membrane-fusion protein)
VHNAKRKLGATLVLALLVGAGCRPPAARDTTAPTRTEGLRVDVREVTLGPIENRLTLSGILAPLQQVAVMSKLPGKLVALNVREGQSVSRDEIVALVNQDLPGQDYKDLQVRAPIAGVIGKTMSDPGSMVSPNSPIALVLDIDQLKVTVSVIESEIGLVRTGQSAGVEVPAFPGREFSGMVSNILPIVDPMSHTGKAEITIPNSGRTLKPGMSATVRLLLGRRESAVTVPREAVIEKMGEKYVFLFRDGQARRASVTTGFDDGRLIEVLSGVRAGDRVITSDLNVLKDGTRVRVREP